MKLKSCYRRIKDHINRQLEEKKIDTKEQIYEEINIFKDILKSMPLEVIDKILPSGEKIRLLTDDEWELLGKELECFHQVKMDEGIALLSKDYNKRDKLWWTDNIKLKNESFYWNRYEKLLRRKLNTDVIHTLDKDTDSILNYMGNPNDFEFDIRGMVVGQVQSGKTGNFTGVLCKAVDAGYKFIVVIAGGLNILRNQTQERIEESFIGKRNGVDIGVGKIDKTEKNVICFTPSDKDFKKADADKLATLDFNNMDSPVILVVKKHTVTLSSLNKWLSGKSKSKIEKHAMLVIDDESDYASPNTKDENNPTKINEQIRVLLEKFNKSSYIAYTATPFANVFIDNSVEHPTLGKDLFPKDFIYALAAPSNYFSPQKIFSPEDDDYKYLIEIPYDEIEYLDKHKKDFDLKYIPKSLYSAINRFLLNTVIRNLRGQRDDHNSMLVHMSRFTNMHKNIEKFVSKYIYDLREVLESYGSLNNSYEQSIKLEELRQDYINEFPLEKYSWNQISTELQNIIVQVKVKDIHKDTEIKLQYRKDNPSTVIVIGGTSLSRGYTVEGLTVSYFIRNTVFYDTLMQMGRWFGYRPDYEDLCKIYTTSEIKDSFGFIVDAVDDLLRQFKKMHQENRTPEEFGLAILEHPESFLQITAKNKSKATEIRKIRNNLSGKFKESLYLSIENSLNISNKELTLDLLNNLHYNFTDCRENKSYLWTNTPNELTINFLEKFRLYSEINRSGTYILPINNIIQLIKETDTKCDIVLFEGESKRDFPYEIEFLNDFRMPVRNETIEIEKDMIRFGNRRIAAANAEKIVLNEVDRYELLEFEKEYKTRVNKEKGEIRDFIRKKMNRPLLMLQILDVSEVKEFNATFLKTEALFAFGICFPSGEKWISEEKTYRVNSVFINSLPDEDEMYEYEE